MGPKDGVSDGRTEAVSYVFFGGLTTVVSWGAYAVFVMLGIDINISNVMSWTCGCLFAFTVNKWFVFRSKSVKVSTITKELGSFFSARIITGVIAIMMFPVLYDMGLSGGLFDIDGLNAKIVTSVVEIALNYLFSKYLVFRKADE
jgi:putative flippase GtrA